MKNKSILRAIGEVKDDYVKEAIPHKNITQKRHWINGGVLVACLILAVLAVIKVSHTNPLEPAPDIGDLPMLTIAEDRSGSMGFEGYMAYDISEIVNNNPWTENTKISTLPVYQNLLVYDDNYQVLGADVDKMKEFLLDVASRLGMDVDNLEITDNTLDEKTKADILEKLELEGNEPEGYFSPSAVIAEDNGIKIEVSQQMTAAITFDPAVTLPDEYNFTYFSPYKQVAAAAEYLKEEYAGLIRMGNPQINIHGGDYALFSEEKEEIYGSQQAQGYSIEFYEGSGDIISEIINYNFNGVAFFSCDDGKLDGASVSQTDLSNKVGDYPIIPVSEAEQLLKNGNYITTVLEETPKLEYSAKVELIYRTDATEQYFMPYYRFYVELPNIQRGNGLKTYGAYYVPAVKGEYISNMPIWDGGFN